MAGKSRKISFYLLVLEKKVPIQGSRQTRFVPLTKNEIEEHFKNIYDVSDEEVEWIKKTKLKKLAMNIRAIEREKEMNNVLNKLKEN